MCRLETRILLLVAQLSPLVLFSPRMKQVGFLPMVQATPIPRRLMWRLMQHSTSTSPSLAPSWTACSSSPIACRYTAAPSGLGPHYAGTSLSTLRLLLPLCDECLQKTLHDLREKLVLPLHARIGIHCGDVVSGIVGSQRPRFCELHGAFRLSIP
jgi:hypothetical protein